MPGHYVYLISSLPMLQYGMKPPFSFIDLLKRCSCIISDDDISVIESVARIEPDDTEAHPTLTKWRIFDTALRNELVKIRSVRKHKEHAYIRGDGYADPSVAAVAMKAHRSASVIDGEKVLDRERWRALDELQGGHYFDLDFLIIYGLKLLILERWGRIRAADASALIEETLRKTG